MFKKISKSFIDTVLSVILIVLMTITSFQIYDLNQKVERQIEINRCYYQIDNYPTLRNIEVMYARIDSIENNLQNR